jgi:hypothetical protein
MNVHTFALTVSAPRDAVFNFLANIENLPRWAGGYCERVYLQRGDWWALTGDGELMLDLSADSRAGVIDLRSGPTAERMNYTPIRVLGLSPRRTLVSFMVIEAPDQSARACERRFVMLRDSAETLLARFGGGELHGATEPLAAAALPELGLN